MTEQERMARPLAEVDPQVYEAIQQETRRQHSQIELIASENFTSEAILEAAGIKTGLIGTVRYEIGERVIPAHAASRRAYGRGRCRTGRGRLLHGSGQREMFSNRSRYVVASSI